MNMESKKKSKLTAEKVFPKSVLSENAKALEFYKTYKKIADITEKIDIAMGRKKIYKTSRVSTSDYKIKQHDIFLTTESYQV